MINIAIVNTSRFVKDADLARWLPVFQGYVDNYLKPHWGFEARLHAVPHESKADPAHWWIVLDNFAGTLQSGALGYHSVHPGGHPYGIIFCGDDVRYDSSITVTITHELAEMLGDPLTTKTHRLGLRRYVLELCDAVEADEQAIDIDGIACSNFVLPSYFKLKSKAPWDYQGRLKGGCPALTLGGYMDYVEGGRSHQVTARRPDGTQSYRSARTGRGQRRANAVWRP